MSTLSDAMQVLDRYAFDAPLQSDYQRHRARYRSDAARILDCHGDGRILEIGAAPCFCTTLLTLLRLPVVAVDLDPGRHQAIIDEFKLDVRQADIERQSLPFADAEFATVLFAETLEHLRIDPLFTLSEINRVMRVGGQLLLTTPNLYSAQNIARFLLGRGITDGLSEFSKLRLLGHMGHVREYAPAEVRRLLEASGFRIEATAFEHYYYPRTRRGLVARVVFSVLPRRLRTFQVILASKVDEGPGLAPLA